MAPQTQMIRQFSPFMYFYFLYFEPIIVLAGAYICITDPSRFLKAAIPLSPTLKTPVALTPVIKLLCTNLGAFYIFFALIEGGVLRFTKEKRIWLGILGAMFACDILHIHAVYTIAPKRMGQFTSWSSDEWISYTSMLGGTLIRGLFLLGVGRS